MIPSLLQQVASPVEVLGPLLGFGLLVVLPIVAILTNHQRKMAELIHARRGPDERQVMLERKIQEMDAEIKEMRSLLADRVIQNDDLSRLDDRLNH